MEEMKNKLDDFSLKMIMLLRFLLSKREILLLDETLAGMNQKEKRKAIELLKQYNQGITVFVIGHDFEDESIFDQTSSLPC